MHHHFYNPYHLGDHLMGLSFFMYWQTHDPNIIIHYAIPKHFIKEIQEFIYMSNMSQDRIYLEVYDNDKSNYHLFWINSPLIPFRHTAHRDHMAFNHFLQEHFHRWIDFLHISIPKSFPPYLFSSSEVYIPRLDYLPSVYHNVDVLIVNSYGMSNQYTMQPQEWDRLAKGIALYSGLKVCTTRKIPGVLSTHDHCLSIYQIGLLSTRIQYMIGLNTSILCASLTDSLPTMKGVFLFGMDTKMTFSNVHPCSSFSQIQLEGTNAITYPIHMFYQTWLHRDPDPDGLKHYLNQFASGSQTLEEIECDIYQSQEAVQKYVTYQYHLTYHRDPDDGGKQCYTHEIMQKKVPRESLWLTHWTSPERFTNALAGINALAEPEKKEQLYQNFQSCLPNTGSSIVLPDTVDNV
jgi:Domain of unknown function (DUF4214)